MSKEININISVYDQIDKINELDWDRCAQNGSALIAKDPFTTFRFFKALEDSGSVGAQSGWVPRYLVAKIDPVIR